MANLVTTRNYDDGQVLVRADLDAFLDDIETFINVTKINDDNIQNSGITGSTKLLNQSVTEAKLATNAISTLKIQDGSVTTSKLADAAVTTAKLADSNVTTTKILDQNVTTAKIADAAVVTAKLAAKSVTDTILSSDPTDDTLRAVSTDSIHDSAITTPKINNGSVTPAKFATKYVTGTLSGTDTGVGSHYHLISSYTTSGRLMRVSIYDGSISVGNGIGANFYIVRYDGSSYTRILTMGASLGSPGTIPFFTNLSPGLASSGQVVYYDTPASGSYQYGIEVQYVSGSNNVTFNNVLMMVEEL